MGSLPIQSGKNYECHGCGYIADGTEFLEYSPEEWHFIKSCPNCHCKIIEESTTKISDAEKEKINKAATFHQRKRERNERIYEGHSND